VTILNLLLDIGRLRSPIVAAGAGTKLVTADNLINLFRQYAAGGLDPLLLTARVTPVAAVGIVTFSTSSGELTITINGVDFVASTGGGDTANAAAMAVLVNASESALIAGQVTATSAADGADAVLTITAVDKGLGGNAITLAASGTGVTAGSARLEDGTDGTVTTYVY
jgi:hypothetical protein